MLSSVQGAAAGVTAALAPLRSAEVGYSVLALEVVGPSDSDNSAWTGAPPARRCWARRSISRATIGPAFWFCPVTRLPSITQWFASTSEIRLLGSYSAPYLRSSVSGCCGVLVIRRSRNCRLLTPVTRRPSTSGLRRRRWR